MSPIEGASAEPSEGRTVIERPPPGLARGRYSVPGWAVEVLGALVVAAGTAYLVRRVTGRVKR